MPKIITVSVKNEDEWVVAKIDLMGGNRSAHVVQALKNYVEAVEDNHGYVSAPEWYVPGKDYSHLNIEIRRKLKPFGYSDEELEESK